MNWSITYFNDKVRREVMSMPAGIVADYVRFTDAMALISAELRLARKRLKDVHHG